MKPLHGGEFGALVKDVFDHNIRSVLQISIERLRLLGENSSNGSLSRIKLEEIRRGKGENTKRGATYY